jgi:threonine synthase
VKIKKQVSGGLFFSVPSGNFGNLISGLYAWKFGLPVSGFIAAMNANDPFGDFISGREFKPRPVVATNSPGLDVSVPSNFARFSSFYEEAPAVMRNIVFPASIGDAATLKAIEFAWNRYCMLLDPHGAVALAAARDFFNQEKNSFDHIIVLATGHPAREAATVEKATGQKVSLPERLALLNLEAEPIAVIDPHLDTLEGLLASCL